jgi:hypothetical protein
MCIHHGHSKARTRVPHLYRQVYKPLSYSWSYSTKFKIDTIENSKFISKNSSNGGGWKKISKENVGNVSYVLKWGSRRVWPVSRECLLLRGTWSYLRICRRSVLPYTRFCNCLLITITFYTLLTSLFCIE